MCSRSGNQDSIHRFAMELSVPESGHAESLFKLFGHSLGSIFITTTVICLILSL